MARKTLPTVPDPEGAAILPDDTVPVVAPEPGGAFDTIDFAPTEDDGEISAPPKRFYTLGDLDALPDLPRDPATVAEGIAGLLDIVLRADIPPDLDTPAARKVRQAVAAVKMSEDWGDKSPMSLVQWLDRAPTFGPGDGWNRVGIERLARILADITIPDDWNHDDAVRCREIVDILRRALDIWPVLPQTFHFEYLADAARGACRTLDHFLRLADTVRPELTPDDLVTPEMRRMWQAVADLNAAALARLSPPESDLTTFRKIQSGALRFATPWQGTAARMLRLDAVTGATLADLHRTEIGTGGKPDTYGVRVSGFPDPADMGIEAGKAWVERCFRARDIREA